jgi:hypothetical protein
VRWEAPNSVNVLRYDARLTPLRCTVERWDYSAEGEAGFSPAEVTVIDLDRR